LLLRAGTLTHKLLATISFASFILLIVSAISMPRIGVAPPDPLFPFKIMPIEYWLGFSTAIAACIMNIVFYKSGRTGSFAWLSLLSLTTFIHVIPKLMFSNLVWTDTYTFVGEVLYALRYGRIGYGSAVDTPALSLFTSQLSLVTGIDHVALAELIPFALPFFMVVFMYAFTRLFCGERASYFAVMVFLSLDYQGFYFNRQSFALVLHFLTLYLVVILFIHTKRTYAVLMLILFSTLVMSHPGSSAAVVLTVITLIIMLALLKALGLFKRGGANGVQNDVRRIFNRPILPSILTVASTSSVIWFAWYIYHFGSLSMVIKQTIISMNEFFSAPYPEEHITATVTLYTEAYMPIVLLRFYELVAALVIGTVLSILACAATKLEGKYLMLASMFFSVASILVYVTYAHRWTGNPFPYSFPALTTLVSWFIFDFKLRKGSLSKYFTSLLKASLLMMIVAFTALMPLLMYSHMAFVYPPDSNLVMLNFLARNGHGSSLVIGGHMDVDYVMFVHNANMLVSRDYSVEVNITSGGWFSFSNSEYNIVATAYRVYVKDDFEKYDPPLTERLAVLENRLSDNPLYVKVYQADYMYKVYSKNW